jgi:hypothetical protein
MTSDPSESVAEIDAYVAPRSTASPIPPDATR